MQVAMGGSSRYHFAIAALVLVCLLRKVEAQSINAVARPRNLNVFQGHNIEFYCYCTPGSTPVSSLKWLHNGVVVASRTTCSGTPLIHLLWSVDSDDEGVYTCRMELSNGTTVERNLSQPLNVVDPSSIQAPAQQYALLHSNTTLNCTTTFSETSFINIMWKRNATDIVSNQIINVELIHEGYYMCEVFLGHLSLVMKKNVDFYVIVPPAITSHPRPFYEITSNQPLTFTVEFQSRFRENTTVTWYLNGRDLPEGRAQTQYSSELDGQTTLQFNPITRSDRGVYIVVVRNSFGIIPLRWRENETSFQVSIIVPPAIPSNMNMSNTTSSQVQITWSLTHQHADERAESLALTVQFSNGTIAQQYRLEGNVTQQMVDTVPGMEYRATVSASNQDGTRTTDPVPFQTSPGQPSISSVEVIRLNRTTFNFSVSLAYTGGGAITHFRVSFRNTGTTLWHPLEDIPVTPSPDSSLVWNGVVSRDEFAAYYQVEFLLSVINQDGFESNTSQAEIDLAPSHQTTAPSHQTTAPLHQTGNLKTILLAIFVPACTVLLLFLVGSVIAGVYCRRKRRRRPRRRKMKKQSVPVRPIDRVNMSSTNRDEAGAVYPQSVKLVELLPRKMIISSGMLQVLNTIGQGEFGSVFKAHLKWHRSAETNVVAVKTMKGVVTPNDIHKLEEEVLKMVSFKHPNVMTLIGVCENLSGGPVIVMPYMANGSVLDYLRRERRNLVLHTRAKESMISSAQTILLGMCLQIAKGMEYLADQKIVHRDLAARNCMIDADGVIKVADFGLAEDVYTTNYYRWKKGDTNLKLPVRWMSPESIQDGIFTEKSDVWSFGVTCWEVFSGGMIPYGGISPMALLHLLQNGERLSKPPNSACTNRIYFLLLQCWDGQPEKRPNFSQLLVTISTMLEVIGGYLVLSATDEGNSLLDTHPFKCNSVTLV